MARRSDEERDRERAARIAAAPYEVAWGKTPVEHRFKKGEKQNFKRGKKRSETVSEIVRRLATEKFRLDLNGDSQTMSAVEIKLLRLKKMTFDVNIKYF